ncbi:ATPase, T2SS/T4P/T4SS family [Streptobacillus moniliformis]|uniref:ATPase, T2SS/T4P/T4SS family n=1 Tax=Streptobacillus moniliformis TaxID=34105 RepID=UPI0007E47AB1|nr:ATPase, T2SS/T4P/T4SS family [Streptobacillus moniliformis]
MTDLEISRELENEKKINFLKENLVGIEKWLNDENISEISLNQDGKIYLDIKGKGRIDSEKTLSKVDGENIIKLVAAFSGKQITEETPIISASLPDGSRFEGLMHQVTNFSHVFSIRKHTTEVIPLEKFVETNFMTNEQKEYIEQAIIDKKNILVVGGTSSGKTTFLNACLDKLKDSEDRISVIEEVRELKCEAKNINFFTSTETVSYRDILRSNMRLNPDRIILGELRTGGETIELLKAWNSGHSGGLATIHANSTLAGLKKVEQYIDEVTVKSQHYLIVEAINVVVNIVRDGTRRYIKEIAEVVAYDKENDTYILNKK